LLQDPPYLKRIIRACSNRAIGRLLILL